MYVSVGWVWSMHQKVLVRTQPGGNQWMFFPLCLPLPSSLSLKINKNNFKKMPMEQQGQKPVRWKQWCWASGGSELVHEREQCMWEIGSWERAMHVGNPGPRSSPGKIVKQKMSPVASSPFFSLDIIASSTGTSLVSSHPEFFLFQTFRIGCDSSYILTSSKKNSTKQASKQKKAHNKVKELLFLLQRFTFKL